MHSYSEIFRGKWFHILGIINGIFWYTHSFEHEYNEFPDISKIFIVLCVVPIKLILECFFEHDYLIYQECWHECDFEIAGNHGREHVIDGPGIFITEVTFHYHHWCEIFIIIKDFKLTLIILMIFLYHLLIINFIFSLFFFRMP